MGFDAQDKVFLVTGSNRGIGLAIVEGAIQRGAAKVYAGVRRLESAQPLVERFAEKVTPIHIDLEKPESIRQAAETANDVQVVINNAGVLRNANPLSDDAVPSLLYETNINVVGLIHMAQAFAPVLKANGGGVFAQLNSVASLKAFADFATYSASKAASYSITQSLRDLLRDQGTRVLSVHPGPIATDMADNAGLGDMAEPPSLVPDAMFQALSEDKFHVFPDTMAKQVGASYQGFAESVVEAAVDENPV